MVAAVARGETAAQAQSACHTLTRGQARFPEAGGANIRRVPQHGPDGRALPSSPRAPCWHLLVVEPSRDGTNAPPRLRVMVIHLPYHTRFGLDDGIRCRCIIALAKVAVAVRRAAQHADFAGTRTVTLATARALENLRPLVLRDHALELHEQLVLGGRALRRVQKVRLDAMTGELFDEQDLIRVLATQPIRAIDEDGLDLSFRGQVAHALQPGPFQRRAA